MSVETIVVGVEILPHGAGLELPSYATKGSAAMDLRAAIEEKIEIAPGKVVLIPTGFNIAIPEGYYGRVAPRSGFSTKKGIIMVNSPGTIDSDYRGEIIVPLFKLSEPSYVLSRGERIAQLSFHPVMSALLEVTAELSNTSRGQGGYGSTGER